MTEHQKRLYATPELASAPESKLATLMIRGYYQALGARAVIFLDKDDTVEHPATGKPTVSGFEEVVAQAQAKHIIVSWDSDSSGFDLKTAGAKYGMQGLNVAELGGVVCFPDEKEIHLVRSSEWFHTLLNQVVAKIYNDENLRTTTAVYQGDPWAMLYAENRFPGSQQQIAMVNRGRRVSASILTGLLDQSRGGQIKRGTLESIKFYRQIAEIMREERNALLQQTPFPDLGGIRDDFNEPLEVVIMSSGSAGKARGMKYMAQVLGLPVFHIGNGSHDNMMGVTGVCNMTVGNGVFKGEPDVIHSQKIMTEGVIELMQEHILPQFA